MESDSRLIPSGEFARRWRPYETNYGNAECKAIQQWYRAVFHLKEVCQMDSGTCIRIWTRNTIPKRYAHVARFDDGEVESTMFVAHVPAAMLADHTYRICNGKSGTDGWMRDGELGLFGVNALDSVPDPDGDGILLIGSWV